MSETTNHLNHSTWECKYHVVFTPKYRKKGLWSPDDGALFFSNGVYIRAERSGDP